MPEKTTIVRIDKFVVPQTARAEFLQKVRATHEILRRQPGFIRDALLEQVSGPGRFNIVTVAEWESQAAIDAARAVVMKAHAESRFSPQEMMARLGIEADIADYKPLDA